jgi:hypothetical protein
MLTVLYFISSLILSSQPEWTWSMHPESGFKILTPTPLLHQVSQVPTDVDVIELHQYFAGSVSDSISSLAFVIDHYILPVPDSIHESEYMRDFFENTIDQLLTTLNGTMVYMDIINQPGRDVCIWKGNYKEGEGVIRGNIILTGDKYYGLQVFGFEKNKPDLLMSKFLDSFRLMTATTP